MAEVPAYVEAVQQCFTSNGSLVVRVLTMHQEWLEASLCADGALSTTMERVAEPAPGVGSDHGAQRQAVWLDHR